jgi:hypothetical protein
LLREWLLQATPGSLSTAKGAESDGAIKTTKELEPGRHQPTHQATIVQSFLRS